MLLFDSLLVCNANDASSAPMKALASEITRKLGKRLRWLSIEVRELTGRFREFVSYHSCLVVH